MKKLLLLTTFLATFSFANSNNTDPLNNIEDVRAALQEIQTFVLSMEGVNGIAIAACASDGSAHVDRNQKWELCLEINTETLEATEALELLFPEGSMYKEIFVGVRYFGVITPQPRMGAGSGR